MSYTERVYPDEMKGASVGCDGRSTFGQLRVRKNSLGLAESRNDFTVVDTVEGRQRAAEALERGMLVYNLADKLLTAEDLKEAE